MWLLYPLVNENPGFSVFYYLPFTNSGGLSLYINQVFHKTEVGLEHSLAAFSMLSMSKDILKNM